MQWGDHSPSSNVAWDSFLDSMPYVGWVCWFSTLLWEVFFHGYSGRWEVKQRNGSFNWVDMVNWPQRNLKGYVPSTSPFVSSPCHPTFWSLKLLPCVSSHFLDGFYYHGISFNCHLAFPLQLDFEWSLLPASPLSLNATKKILKFHRSADLTVDLHCVLQ